jgi:hypothetical protein
LIVADISYKERVEIDDHIDESRRLIEEQDRAFQEALKRDAEEKVF